MSKYTTEVRFLCEHYAGLETSEGYKSIDNILNKAYPKVFSFDFPIFDETYRPVLCKKILKHFYTREIGEETVGLWQLRLDTRLNEIMPYYNKLYESELLTFNPFYDVDLTRDHTLTVKGNKEFTTDNEFANKDVESFQDNGTMSETGEETSSGSSTNQQTTNSEVNTTNHEVVDTDDTETNKYSDTPQGSLQNVIAGTYLTNANLRERDMTVESTGEGTNEGTVNASSNGTTEDSKENTINRTTENARSGSVVRDGTSSTDGTEVIDNLNTYIEHVIGKNGGKSYASLLNEFRETFLNIDLMIIEELNDLFMQIW